MVHGVGLAPAWPSSALARPDLASSRAAAPAQRTGPRTAHLESEAWQAGALEVTTDDGDKVSISFAAWNQLQSEVSGAAGDRSSGAYRAVSTSAGVAVTVEVDGTLDREEMTDIRKLMHSLAAATRDARRGDLSHASARMARSATLDSLQSFRYAYEQNARLEFEELRAMSSEH